MAQRQFRSDDTSPWNYGFGSGSDGALTISADTVRTEIDSACTGTATQTSLTATNVSFAPGQTILIHQTRGTGAGNWELNKISSYVAGTITLAGALINTYATGAQVVVIPQYTDVTINTTKILTVKAWDGTVGGILAFLASGTTTVTGTILGTGKGFRGGSATTTNLQIGYAGESPAVAYNTTRQTSNGSSIGGGGGGAGNVGSYTAAGGAGGGNGTAGANGGPGQPGTPGIGGGTGGTAPLVTALFGGAGGQAGGFTGWTPGIGGNGGSFILIISKNITVTGAITNAGGSGTVVSTGNAGGSGAGGSTLLKTQVAVLGTNLVTASGGPEIPDTAPTWDVHGGAGGAGRIHLDYKTSVSGTTTPALDSTQDATLNTPTLGGAFLLNMI